MAQSELISFEIATNKNYEPNWHHEIIAESLQDIEAGKLRYLMIMCPPRSGKSQQATIDFPAWYLGKHPDKEVITASYSGELAFKFGGETRDLISSVAYKSIFPNVLLKEDEKSKGNWRTRQNGSYISLGIGGAATGRGADIFIIDDPLKNREEANSQTFRDSRWDWYRSTARTRLSPTGAIILILCLTGDTSILMADGSKKLLRDIRIGDRVKTYNNGKLSDSFVKNWKNNGQDFILKIITSSGRIIRGNERHPFLTYHNGKLQWTRIKDLTTEHKIVTLKDSGENGKENIALNVKSQFQHKGIVPRTMRRKCGLMVIVHHLFIIKGLALIRNSSFFMALLLRNMRDLVKNKMESVPFAGNCLKLMLVPAGVASSALTTAIKQEKLEDCYAIIATSQLDILKLKKQPLLWQNTSDFTLEDIISVNPDGVEEVFDIQIEKTENFIANGVVSHNTRWHKDDLAGRLLAQEGDKWKVICFPAIAIEDEKFRKKGEALWPSRYSLKEILDIKNTLGSYEFSALYQQTPISSESQEFKESWFKYRTLEYVDHLQTRNFLTIDTAMSEKASADNVGWCRNFVDRENNWNLIAFKTKDNPRDLISRIFQLQEEDGYEKIGIEKTIYSDVLKFLLEDEQRKRNKFLPIVMVEHKQIAKETRIRGLIPRYENKTIYHIDAKDLEEELLNFPKGVHDDVCDAAAYQFQIAEPPAGLREELGVLNNRKRFGHNLTK